MRSHPPVQPGLNSRRGAGTRPRTGSAGFTLIELLIALVLSSLMFSAMIVVFQTQTRVNTVEQDVVEIQQNARVGLNALSQDIRQAGYFVDQFNRQPIWLDAAPYQMVFNANLSDQFVSMHRDSAVPLSDGSMYQPGDWDTAPQNENLPTFLDRYLNESETIRLTLDRTYDGQITSADRQEGTPNPHVYTLTKEVNGNPPSILAYNVRGPDAFPNGEQPQPLFSYWGTFASSDSLSLWGDSDGNGRLSPSEITALTPVPRADLPDIRQVDVNINVETSRPDRDHVGIGSAAGAPNHYRSYNLRSRVRARNVGINPMGLVLCGDPPASPLNPVGYDTPYDRGGSITLEWDSSPDEYSGESDVVYYTVYRRLGSGDYEVVGNVQALGVDTTYVMVDDGDIDNFNAPVDGEGYYYYLAAWDCAPQESNPSEVIGPIVSLPNGPAPPTITDAWDTPCDAGADITLLFSRSPQDDGSGTGVSSYVVYRGTTADSSVVSKVLVDTVAATGAASYEYHDNDPNAAGLPPEDDQPYYYILRAVQGGVASSNSNEWGPVWSDEGLSAPRLTAVDDKPGDDGTALILTWRRSASEDCSPAPTEYRIYRRPKGSTTWTAIDNVPVAFQPTYTYEDDNGGAGLVNGTTYEYEVHVRTSGSAEASNIMEGTPRDNPPVGAPTNLVAEDVPCDADGDIQVSWARSPDDGAGAYTADEYRLYRKVEGGTYSLMRTFTATGATSYSWVDNDSTNGMHAPVVGNVYWYRVTAYDSDSSSESDPSNEDDALSDGSPGAPEITAAYDTYGGGNREIRVEWNASPDDGGCSDSVTRYHIYRTTTPGSYGDYIGTLNAADADNYVWNDNLDNS
ncbi:MAG: prepilin-type N-terminal cleavage/methylation domain-containing protein, partial [bacterium]